MSADTFLHGYANPAALVSTEWVWRHRTDPGIRLVEVDVDTDAYERGHIEGAAGLNWTTQLCDPIRRDIPTPEAWRHLLGSIGVTPETRLIFYGDNNNWFAAYAYWVATLYGHQNLALMNGGRKKWELEGRPLTTAAPSFTPTTYTTESTDIGKRRAYLHDIMHMIGSTNGTTLVDVRSPAEFSGEVLAPPGLSETAQRAGHIPGARNIPWALAANEDGTFKSAEELRALYIGKGVEPDREVVTYCRIGERSSHSWFVLTELLGYPTVRNYDGSWTEYGSVVAMPIENPSLAGGSR